MEEEIVEEPLLEKKKKYYENCPGCKVDKANELSEGQGVPFTKLFIVWMLVLCTGLPTSSVFPFLYFMVRDFNIAKTEADISSYAGYETLHNHNYSDESIEDAKALENANNGAGNENIQKNENLFLNWPLMSSIIAYCIFTLHDITYLEVFSLWAVSPQRFGGLNFTSDNVGNVLSISGFALIIYQLTIYPYVEKASGPILLGRISSILSIPLLQSYPFIPLLSGVALYIVLSICSILKNMFSFTIATGLLILQNRAVEQHQRGAANGISMTGMSLFNAIGPATGGTVHTYGVLCPEHSSSTWITHDVQTIPC
ncbi:hypothetical protein ACSQ67_024147 [Phaseolus vulgaris]